MLEVISADIFGYQELTFCIC